MDSHNEQELRFIAYLNDELDPEAEREMLREIAEDPDLRAMLRFELQLNDALPDWEEQQTTAVPDGFTDRVMMQLPDPAEAAPSLWQQVWDGVADLLWKQRELMWRPAYAVMVLLLMLTGAWWIGQQRLATPSGFNSAMTVSEAQRQVQPASAQVNQKVMLRFVYIDDEAESIAVAGDFSDWEPIPLTQKLVNGKRVWTGMVSMSRGEHNYMFRVNGEQWVTDPMAAVQREDGFGNKNAVIYL
jgi:hypothetical protein